MFFSLCVGFRLIIVISMEKYLAVCFPFWCEEYVTKARVVCVIVATAIINTVMTFSFPNSRSGDGYFHLFAFFVVFVATCVFL